MMTPHTVIQIQPQHLEQLLVLLKWRASDQSLPDISNTSDLDSVIHDMEAGNLRIFAVEIQNQFCGYLSAARIPKPDGRVVLYIDELWVAPPFRRQGIAKALMSSCLESAKGEPVWRIRLDVNVENPAARALYISFGFTETAAMFCELQPESVKYN